MQVASTEARRALPGRERVVALERARHTQRCAPGCPAIKRKRVLEGLGVPAAGPETSPSTTAAVTSTTQIRPRARAARPARRPSDGGGPMRTSQTRPPAPPKRVPDAAAGRRASRVPSDFPDRLEAPCRESGRPAAKYLQRRRAAWGPHPASAHLSARQPRRNACRQGWPSGRHCDQGRLQPGNGGPGSRPATHVLRPVAGLVRARRRHAGHDGHVRLHPRVLLLGQLPLDWVAHGLERSVVSEKASTSEPPVRELLRPGGPSKRHPALGRRVRAARAQV